MSILDQEAPKQLRFPPEKMAGFMDYVSANHEEYPLSYSVFATAKNEYFKEGRNANPDFAAASAYAETKIYEDMRSFVENKGVDTKNNRVARYTVRVITSGNPKKQMTPKSALLEYTERSRPPVEPEKHAKFKLSDEIPDAPDFGRRATIKAGIGGAAALVFGGAGVTAATRAQANRELQENHIGRLDEQKGANVPFAVAVASALGGAVAFHGAMSDGEKHSQRFLDAAKEAEKFGNDTQAKLEMAEVKQAAEQQFGPVVRAFEKSMEHQVRVNYQKQTQGAQR